MAIADTITSMQTHLTNAYTSIANKNGTIPAQKNLENLSNAIDTITGGGGGKNFSKYFIKQTITGNDCTLEITSQSVVGANPYMVGQVINRNKSKIYIVEE